MADEVVHHDVLAILFDFASEGSLPGEPFVATGPGVADDIGLYDGGFEGDVKALAQELRQCGWYRVDALALVGVGTDQYWLVCFHHAQ